MPDLEISFAERSAEFLLSSEVDRLDGILILMIAMPRGNSGL
jgi:hypothetical protein